MFLTVLVYIKEQQNCPHKICHTGIEIVSNACSKIGFASLLRKKLFLLFYIMLWYCHFLGRWVKPVSSKMENGSYFPNDDTLIRTLSWYPFQLVWVILNVFLTHLTFPWPLSWNSSIFWKLVVTVKKGHDLFKI